MAAHTFKAAGAEVRSCPENVRLGYIPVGAPVAKRLALSVLSLRAACLPALTCQWEGTEPVGWKLGFTLLVSEVFFHASSMTCFGWLMSVLMAV